MESFKILVLSGGGIKGLLQIGALEELEKEVGEIHKHFTKGIYGCSVGSLFAVALGFGISIENIKKLSENLSNFNNLIDMEKMPGLSTILTKKGVFPMIKFEKVLIDSFNSVGIEIKNKKLCDALIPLYINSSNISKGVPTIFTGNIPVLTALKASCCLPFIFQPQLINDNIYVDGGFITNILMSLVPKEDRDLCLGITIIHTKEKIKANKIEKLSPLDFLYRLYKISCLYEHSKNPYKNNINVYYDKGFGISEFSKEEKEEMILIGSKLCRSFLTQCTNEKLIKN